MPRTNQPGDCLLGLYIHRRRLSSTIAPCIIPARTVRIAISIDTCPHVRIDLVSSYKLPATDRTRMDLALILIPVSLIWNLARRNFRWDHNTTDSSEMSCVCRISGCSPCSCRPVNSGFLWGHSLGNWSGYRTSYSVVAVSFQYR